MEKNEILKRIGDIFKKVFDDENLSVSYETTSYDVPGWDSLSFIMLLYEIENAFKIKFTSLERISWKNVGDIVDSISNKVS